MKQTFNKLVVSTLIVTAALLFLTSVVWARWSRGSFSQLRDVEPGDVCTDSISIGFAMAGEDDGNGQTVPYEPGPYTLKFYDAESANYGEDAFPDDFTFVDEFEMSLQDHPASSPDECNDVETDPDNPIFDPKFCGFERHEWGQNVNVNVGDKFYLQILDDDGQTFQNSSPAEPDGLDGPHVFTVGNCPPPVVEIIEIEPGNIDTVVTDALVFRARAYDPDVGPSDGDGMANVDMRILDANGVVKRQQTESAQPYCLFGGNNPCPVWNFEEHNYEWPDGQLIENGTHTLRAMANTPDGRSKTINSTIQIQLPLITNLLQTGPGITDSIVSDSLVFQLEAYVGPRYSDGQDIDNVVMSILDSDENTVYEKTENGQPYCLFGGFGGGNPCPVWNFADNDYNWPDGQPIQNGAHTLQATVHTTDGRSEILEFLQLPLVTNLIQTGPDNTASVISETLVFQVEAYVGPNNNDGDDIDKVELIILNANNLTVHQEADSQIKYCAFGGGDPDCNQWVFADHDYKWLDGQPIQNGAHTLRATIYTSDGRSETVDYEIELQLPTAEAQKIFVYLPAILK